MKYYLIVIDSFGAGADDIAAEYGDEGSNTALSAAKSVPGPKWHFLGKMGLGNAMKISGKAPRGCPSVRRPLGDFGLLRKMSPGKDTQTGHWELAGLRVSEPMITFPPEYPSFPADLIEKIEKETGRKVLGNYAFSGTEIIKILGKEHEKTGGLIVYTSADSVLQIAANEKIIPHEELWDICRRVRKICDGYGIGRVIARPFTGNETDGYTRTKYRKDFSVELPGEAFMKSTLKGMGVTTVGVGKIGDIFNMQGIDINFPDKGNEECMKRVLGIAEGKEEIPDRSFIFVNLVDTDSQYGHRRDPEGYCRCVENVSEGLSELYELMSPGDRLAVTADHGCDPCFKGTDHTREYVPYLAMTKNEKGKMISERPVEGFDYAAKDAVKYFTKIPENMLT